MLAMILLNSLSIVAGFLMTVFCLTRFPATVFFATAFLATALFAAGSLAMAFLVASLPAAAFLGVVVLTAAFLASGFFITAFFTDAFRVNGRCVLVFLAVAEVFPARRPPADIAMATARRFVIAIMLLTPKTHVTETDCGGLVNSIQQSRADYLVAAPPAKCLDHDFRTTEL